MLGKNEIATIAKVAATFTTLYGLSRAVNKINVSDNSKVLIGLVGGGIVGGAILHTSPQRVVKEGLWPAIVKSNYEYVKARA